MSNAEVEKLMMGEHEIKDNGHVHAYAALEHMSEPMREQIFHNARNSGHGGLFTVHKDGRNVEYKLSHDGYIHEAHH